MRYYRTGLSFKQPNRSLDIIRTICAAVLVIILSNCSSPPAGNEWGIHVSSVRLTGADHFVDFRYRVKTPEKAAAILARNEKVFLIDQATHTKLTVPVTKLGPLRANAVKPQADREYVILFANVNKVIKPGSKVTLEVGDKQIKDLTVQ